MKLSQVKSILKELETIDFKLPNGALVPKHFHITEIGKISKHFIDCGGIVRKEEVVNFQLWHANDYQHRLHPQKLLDIIKLSEDVLHTNDLEIEVEYQSDTIGKFGLDFDGTCFVLTSKQTNCLAIDKCGISTAKPKIRLSSLHNEPCCAPDGNCC